MSTLTEHFSPAASYIRAYMLARFPPTRSAYIQTAKLAERGIREHRTAHPCRCDTGYTFTAGADRQIRLLSSYRQPESRRENAEFPATESDKDMARLEEKVQTMYGKHFDIRNKLKPIERRLKVLDGHIKA